MIDILPFVFSVAVACAVVGLPLCGLIAISWCCLMVVVRIIGTYEQEFIAQEESHKWN